jgi:hypothetical protein
MKTVAPTAADATNSGARKPRVVGRTPAGWLNMRVQENPARKLQVARGASPKAILDSMAAKKDSIDLNELIECQMAGNLHVRNLDDDLIARLKRLERRAH